MSQDSDRLAPDEFAARYGPWALVAGASDGVGAAFARELGRRGVNVVLVARRAAQLEEVAHAIGSEFGVQTRQLAVDLAHEEAVPAIRSATSDVEVGIVVYCAGGDPNYSLFLDQPVDAALSMVTRNCVVPMQLCHHFAKPMRDRGRGGIVLLSSGAGLVGGPHMVAYGATKAFDIVMAEALWAELHGAGVDVLALVLGVTDTPSLRRILAKRGVLANPDDPSPIPGAVTSEQVVEEAFDHLPSGPTWFAGEMSRQGAEWIRSMPRPDAVRAMIEAASGGVMAERSEEATRS